MAITLTERAARHVREFAARRDSPDDNDAPNAPGLPGLRLGVRPSGCSGLAYVMEFANETRAGDLSFLSNGVRLLIDPKSLVYIDGAELDYVREGLQEGFKFKNPNVRDECGCGESFTV